MINAIKTLSVLFVGFLLFVLWSYIEAVIIPFSIIYLIAKVYGN